MYIRMALAVIIVLVPIAAVGQSNERNLDVEAVIWKQLQAIAPKAVDDFKAGTVAMDNDNYEEAVRLYRNVVKQAPEFDAGLRRLGTSLALAGQTKEGLSFLEKAVEKKQSPENLTSLARFLAYPGEGKESPKQDKQRALVLAKQASAANGSDDPSYIFLVAQIALDLQQEEEFRAATNKLVDKYPEAMVTHYCKAIRAAMDEDWSTAEREIKIAESLGLPAELVNDFLASGVHSRATIWRYAYYAMYMVAVWAGGLALLFISGKILSLLTVRSIETADPNLAASDRQVTLRKFYRNLINIAGLYYYISIPVVMFLVIAVAGSITYGFIMSGRIPLKLLFFLCIGAVVTVYKMIRSLFIRHDPEDPGRSLRQEEAPQLWSLTREVAETIGTRPIDDIRVTPGTDLAVYEKGSFTERTQDRARRTLILGVGVLNDFDQSAFRAVLAHEYGHFSHRDTAGGDVALRVQRDIVNFATAMIVAGQAVWWNIAFLFLRVYHFIFRRITYGASRLQEVLADRLAVLNYGANAFEDGLKHVIRRSVEFEDVAYREITDAANAGRSLQNLYELKTGEEQGIEDKISEVLNRQTALDDSHPSPAERFRLARRITHTAEPLAGGMVWDLFTDRESLTKEMSSLIETQAVAVEA